MTSTPLSLNLSPDEEVWIESAELDLEGTPYDAPGVQFRVKVQPITRKMMAAVQRRHTRDVRGRQRVDETAVAGEMFSRCVLDWEGICDDSGSPIPCNGETKAVIADVHWQLAAIITAAALDINARTAARREDEEKNSERSGNGD